MRSDEERLLDILDESGLVLKYVPPSREEFDADEVVQAALRFASANGRPAWEWVSEAG